MAKISNKAPKNADVVVTLFNKKEQSLHDMAGKTLVVSAE